MPQGPKSNPLMKPFVVLALPGMYLFYKYNQYKRRRKENAKRRLTERELQHLNNKIAKDAKPPEDPASESKECVESQPVALPQKQVQVCILGADAPTGYILSFLLKQNPFVSTLHLQGTAKVDQMGIDLSHFDTKCKIRTYCTTNSAAMAAKSADIVLLMGLETQPPKTSMAKVVMAEGPRVVTLAETCTKYSPKAILVVATAPVSVMVPIVEQVFKKTDWYHPGKILGAIPLAQVKANSLAAHYQNLDPQSVYVPIIGGPDLDVAVPLFSQATPAGMSLKDSEKMMEAFRDSDGANCPQSQAFSMNRLVTNIALGVTGVPNSLVTAFVRSNIINTCRHIVCTVEIAKHGIVHNYGVPRLFKTELKHFEKSLLTLKARENMAEEFVYRPDQRSLPAFMVREIEEERVNKEGIVR